MAFITMPDGNMFDAALIKRVTVTKTKSIFVHDGFGRSLYYGKFGGEGLSEKIRQLVDEFRIAGKNGVQPDWSFLTEVKKASVK